MHQLETQNIGFKISLRICVSPSVNFVTYIEYEKAYNITGRIVHDLEVRNCIALCSAKDIRKWIGCWRQFVVSVSPLLLRPLSRAVLARAYKCRLVAHCVGSNVPRIGPQRRTPHRAREYPHNVQHKARSDLDKDGGLLSICEQLRNGFGVHGRINDLIVAHPYFPVSIAHVDHVVVEWLRLGVATRRGEGLREELTDNGEMRRADLVVESAVERQDWTRPLQAVACQPQLIHRVDVDSVEFDGRTTGSV